MDEMPTSNSKSSSSSDTNDNNVSKLSDLAEQLQLTTQVGPRRFCDDVLLDALHFLRRNEHAHVRLASRRLQWLSHRAYARYPPREVHWLEVRGVHAPPVANSVSPSEVAVRWMVVANSMRVHPPSGSSYLTEFPSVEPPDDIVHLSELDISDFIGPELLHFLRVSARLLGKCRMIFTDFDNFVRYHSVDFIARFFGLFPSANRAIELRSVSTLPAALFRDHPAIFDCTHLIINCLDAFPLDALQGWLHLDEQQPPKQQQKGRNLVIDFDDEVQVNRSIGSVELFVQQLRQHFLYATSCCPFTMSIGFYGGHVLPELDTFVEDNGRTGELLEFRRLELPQGYYQMVRKRRESEASAAETGRATTTTKMGKETMVYIRKVVQGDK